ncbi:hypothetical protein BKA67DRAFT_424234 [Truncatella angustata]|uniref:Uncharacterized protein n=1 Tax=Truncatella angustata TaxID=152316 RepID=A0A9P8RJL6_9PEZI|nr:uncharacterized protein BKA67DRAFT_424234 [Truncatella angustata]KAH6647024.1 hypothetical protein BKA67DRAFT_424234 [Truncatella angustata]
MVSGSSEKMSPDSVSSLFPDRPIRPLPKRRLRERLSPEAAGTIKYPLEHQNNAPLFYYPYNLKAEAGAVGLDLANLASRQNSLELAQEVGLRHNGSRGGHDDDGLLYQNRRSLATRPHYESVGHVLRTPPRAGQGRHQAPQAPPSTASSVDGYDSFENTNNKKKRKIPTAGESILNGSHVLTDPSILGVPSPPMTGDEGPGDALATTPSPYAYGGVAGSPVQGISGPGRGRYGRNRNGRSPLRQVPDPNSNWPVKTSKSRYDGDYPPSPGEKKGIISSAIASAGKLPVPQGQENISLLQQQASTKASPASSQFTFTFDSQVSGTVPWPGSESTSPRMVGNSHNQQVPMPRTQDNPYYGANARSAHNGQLPLSGSAATQTGASSSVDGTGRDGAPVNAPPKKHRRRGNPLVQAAKQRRQDQEYKNYHHPPTPEELWICEFCEYERIFGRPPEALIRQYEIKDRRRRREEAERRRLLEKAKMKSRKGKKPGKLPAKNNAAAQDRNAVQASGNQAPLMDNEPSQETHGEDYEEGDYYDEDVHDDSCPNVAPGQDFESHTPLAGDAFAGGTGHDHRVPVA